MGMTIEDTISDLTELKICGVVPFTKGTISGGNYKVITEECLDTAIATMRKYQKLEQEPTTKNDLGVDCISRADAIRAMQDKAKKLTNEDTINGLCGAVAILYEMPSVTPQTRKGHWIEHEIKDTCRWLTCSVCGYEWVNKKENFCPNCGAKMVEPQESEG